MIRIDIINKLTTYIALMAVFLVSPMAVAGDKTDLEKLALQYFHARIATQQPDATPEDLETYLALLTDNVGYEHKPYRLLKDGQGEVEGGKKQMRKGMTYYLGGNEKYTGKIDSVAVGNNAIAIQYSGIHQYRRGGEGPVLTEQYTAMEVLEVINGKISIIREYRE